MKILDHYIVNGSLESESIPGSIGLLTLNIMRRPLKAKLQINLPSFIRQGQNSLAQAEVEQQSLCDGVFIRPIGIILQELILLFNSDILIFSCPEK